MSSILAILLFAFQAPNMPPEEKPTPIELDSLKSAIDRLANANKPPVIAGDVPDQFPLFTKEYDWKEQSRILGTMEELTKNIDKAWAALIEATDDKRYCLTLEGEQSVENYSVGDVCASLLMDSVASAYLSLVPKNEAAFRQMNFPAIVPPDEFLDWLRKQHKAQRQLYELQIDACRWAIGKAPTLSETSATEKQAFVRAMETRIKDLQASKTLVAARPFIQREIRNGYSTRRADQIRSDAESGR